MAIDGSSAKVTTATRDSLMTTAVDTSILGNSALGISEGKTAGITEKMAVNVSSAINEYKKNIEQILGKLHDVDSSNAFRGTQIKDSLTKFIEGVKEVSKSYLDGLAAAEKEIVDSVATAYAQQDIDLSGQLGKDTGTVQSAAWTGNKSID